MNSDRPRIPEPDPDFTYQPGPHRLAILAAAVTVPLLVSGAQVTTYRVGMAVPDWPTTFGVNMFLYNMWKTSTAVFIEHRHRLFGSALGLIAIVLAVWFVLADRRAWMKALAIGALAAVCVQGLLGGGRVLRNSTTLAAVHGCTAQAVFALLTVVCVVSGRDWMMAAPSIPDPDHLRRRSAVVLALVYGQIVAGAWLRHFGAGLLVHLTLAAAVWGHAVALGWRIERIKEQVPGLVGPERVLMLAVTLQVAMGIAAWFVLRPFDGVARPVSLPQAAIRGGHVVNGALLLAAAVVLTLRAFRHLARVPGAGVALSSPRDLEAVG